jgi:hypothetical protein
MAIGARYRRSGRGALFLGGILAAALVWSTRGPGSTSGAETRIDRGAEVAVVDAGPLEIRIHLSHTAQLFHVVDQLSGWSEFCHAQYRREMAPLEAAEEAALKRYREVRLRHPWNSGLEELFYTSADLAEAVDSGVGAGIMTAQDGETIRVALERLEPRVASLIREESARLEWFRDRIAARDRRLAEVSVALARWFQVPRLEVDAFLIANPSAESFGGGFHGGRLAIEVPGQVDPLPMFLHELLHAFLARQRDAVERILERSDVEPGLDFQMLDEGIAHALSPGLYSIDPAADDELARELEELTRDESSSADHRHRVLRFALALRPILARDLESSAATFVEFLPRAIEAWGNVVADWHRPNAEASR